jgi:hypothetical protein
MSITKEPIDPDHVRSIPPEGFSWIDRRFVREGFMEHLPRDAILLYLFLVAVSDGRGLSFYADPTVLRILKLSRDELAEVRARLVSRKLILYRSPLYQVLPLPERARASERSPASPRKPGEARGGNPLPLSEISQLAKGHLATRHPNRFTEGT